MFRAHTHTRTHTHMCPPKPWKHILERVFCMNGHARKAARLVELGCEWLIKDIWREIHVSPGFTCPWEIPPMCTFNQKTMAKFRKPCAKQNSIQVCCRILKPTLLDLFTNKLRIIFLLWGRQGWRKKTYLFCFILTCTVKLPSQWDKVETWFENWYGLFLSHLSRCFFHFSKRMVEVANPT